MNEPFTAQAFLRKAQEHVLSDNLTELTMLLDHFPELLTMLPPKRVKAGLYDVYTPLHFALCPLEMMVQKGKTTMLEKFLARYKAPVDKRNLPEPLSIYSLTEAYEEQD